MNEFETWVLPEYPYDTNAGDLSLNFINSAQARARGELVERLPDYRYLLAWASANDVLTEPVAQQLLQAAQRRKDHAMQVWRRALALREALYLLFRNPSAPSASAINTLNKELSSAMVNTRLLWQDNQFQWSWREMDRELDCMLWPVARAGATLLTSPLLSSVRFCANEDCDWIFIDTTKNHSRRWCEMKSCGNRAKARRHHQRQRTQPIQPLSLAAE